jgi:hypothetical protein
LIDRDTGKLHVPGGYATLSHFFSIFAEGRGGLLTIDSPIVPVPTVPTPTHLGAYTGIESAPRGRWVVRLWVELLTFLQGALLLLLTLSLHGVVELLLRLEALLTAIGFDLAFVLRELISEGRRDRLEDSRGRGDQTNYQNCQNE